MLVSVTDRTREIGTRKAVGASGPAIMTQFIMEALTVAGMGGLIGVVLSRSPKIRCAQFHSPVI